MKLSINFEAFKPLLKDFFSAPESFLKEACQNSERAGATRIDITYDKNSRVMLIEDNGHGFTEESWGAFFDICTSSWSEEIQKGQKPFGIGSLSLLVPSSEVAIWSHDTMEEYCEELLTCSEYESRRTTTQEYLDGTMIGLKIKEDFDINAVLKKLNSIFKGFPIDVFFNGVEIKRPHAIGGSLSFTETEFGLINLDNINRYTEVVDTKTYLQGYLISSLSSISGYSACPEFVIHLDSTQFNSRVPDRTQLVLGTEECELQIKKHILDNYINFLASKYVELGADAFSLGYWDVAKSYLPHIARTLPIPVKYFKTPSSLYFTHEHGSEDLYTETNDSLESLVVLDASHKSFLQECFLHQSGILNYAQFSGIDNEESRSLLCHTFMFLNKSSFIDPLDLPESHWAMEFLRKEEEITGWEVGVKGESRSGTACTNGINIGMTIGSSVYLDIILSDGATMKSRSFNQAVFLDDKIYLPRHFDSFTNLARSSFECSISDEWGCITVDSYFLDQAAKALKDKATILKCEDVESALKIILKDQEKVLDELKSIFGEKRISFELGDSGSISVV